MKKLEYHTNKLKELWGDGPWLTEPDKAQWPDGETGLPCLAVRHPTLGHWCGYVGVSRGHALYEKEDCDSVDVHGGVSFTDKCHTGDDAKSICHIVEDGENDDVWWIGFDCAHLYDLSPGYSKRMKIEGTYRTLEYVRNECAALAKKLKEMRQ